MTSITILIIVLMTAATVLMAHAVIFFAVARWFTNGANGKHTGAPWYVLYYDWLDERGDMMNIFFDKNLTRQQREEKKAKQRRAKQRREDRRAKRRARRKAKWLS